MCAEFVKTTDYPSHVSDRKCLVAKGDRFNRCPLCHDDIPPGEEGWRTHLMGGLCPGNDRTKYATFPFDCVPAIVCLYLIRPLPPLPPCLIAAGCSLCNPAAPFRADDDRCGLASLRGLSISLCIRCKKNPTCGSWNPLMIGQENLLTCALYYNFTITI